MKITRYDFSSVLSLRLAVLTDVHNVKIEEILSSLQAERPNVICIVGDLLTNKPLSKSKNSLELLFRSAEIAPTFLSLGNHERFLSEEDYSLIQQTGVTLLDNSFAFTKDGKVCFGGLTSFQVRRTDGKMKNLSWLNEFEKQVGYKVLLCHHPEYYPKYLRGRKIDLVLSGHAHGGQIRIFNQGIFAPGQGFFPKYTKGIYEGNLLVSTGLAKTRPFIPRLFNETELLYVNI